MQTRGRHRGSGGEAWNSGAELELGGSVIGRSAGGRDRHGVGGQVEVFEDVRGTRPPKPSCPAPVVDAVGWHLDAVAAEAAIRMAYTAGYRRARPDVGLAWSKIADGLVRRIGQEDGLVGADLLDAIGSCHEARGAPSEAVPYIERSLELRERVLGDYGKARVVHERALRLYERTVGLDHPDVAMSINNLANAQ